MKSYEVFEQLALVTWNTLNHAHGRSIRIGEDAITTYNLLTIDSLLSKAVVVEDTRANESTKGADFELWVGRGSTGWFRYAVQAKRLTISSSRYETLAHMVGSKPQIDILEKYAQANRAAPIYCFFNYSRSFSSSNCCMSCDSRQHGCSITPSSVVRKAIGKRGGRSYKSIHSQKETLPWRCLVKCPRLLDSEREHSVVSPGYSYYYKNLPIEIQSLQQKSLQQNGEISRYVEPVSEESQYSFENSFPRWVAVIELEVEA